MPIRFPFAMIIALALGGCGGGSGASFDDPITALEAAGQARAERDPEAAMAAYRFAAANAGDRIEIKYEALLGLGEVQAGEGDIEGAIATFARVEEECSAVYDSRGAQRIIDAWIRGARDVQLATDAVEAAEDRFPDEVGKFARQKEGIEALDSGDEEALSELGYVGD